MANVVIVGAGPVGCALALALEHEEQIAQIHVYDRAAEIPFKLTESYPIGVNNRGMATLRLFGAEEAVKAKSCLIHGWKIFVKTWNVAAIESKQCWGTTRGNVNKILFDMCDGKEKIQVHFNHKLKGVDFDKKILNFVNTEGNQDVEVAADKIFACDGVWSATRTALAEHWDGLKVDTWAWNRQFRCLYSEKSTPKLDENYHNILTGNYTATLQEGYWSCTVGMEPNSKAAAILGSPEASPANIAYLKKYLAEKAPQTEGLFDDSELEAYFSRKVFQGAIVKVSRLQYQDWVVLMGDAAHSVFPATGEGVNSGLEDVKVLYDTLQQVKQENGGTMKGWFKEYEKVRYPDTLALCDLAKYVEGAATRDDGAHKFAHGFATATTMLGRKIAGSKYGPMKEDLLFGAASKDGPFPYSEVVKKWKDEMWLAPKLYNALTLFRKRKPQLFESDSSLTIQDDDEQQQEQVQEPQESEETPLATATPVVA